MDADLEPGVIVFLRWLVIKTDRPHELQDCTGVSGRSCASAVAPCGGTAGFMPPTGG